MVRYSQFLKDFLAKRGMERPNGLQPLYQYQTSYEEYQLLQEILKDTFRHQYSNRISKEWAGLFTLYVSEWFRRDYTEKWTWEFALKKIQMNDLNVEFRNQLVSAGLQSYWKRPIVQYTKGNNYLGSVFKEGGFPSRLLQDDGNKYISIFQKAIFLHLEKKCQIYELREAIGDELKKLPKAFEYDETLALVIEIVELIITKVEDLDLTKSQDPIFILDDASFSWRNEFPLPIDNDNDLIDKFLRNLFKSTSSKIADYKKMGLALKCNHYLSEDFQKLFTSINLPEEIKFTVDTKFQLNSTRGHLVIKEGLQNKSHFLCIGYLSVNEESINAEVNKGYSKEILRKAYAESLYLCLEIDGVVVSHIEMKDTALDFENLPISFNELEKYTYIAQGALKTSEHKIMVSLPLGASFGITNAEIQPQYVGKFHDFCLYVIDGLQRIITIDGDEIEIKCSHDKTEFEQILFKAKNLCHLNTVPSIAFHGLPEVVNNRDKILLIKKHNLLLSSLSSVLGKQTLTVQSRDSETLFKKQIVILPKEFHLEIKAGCKLGQAEINITSDELISIEVLDDAIRLEILRSDQTYKCYIEYSEIPLEIVLKVIFNSGGEFLLKVPFPAKGIKLVNDFGEMTSSNLVVSDLLDTELIVYSYDRPTRFYFEAKLKSKNLQEQDRPYYRTSIDVKQGVSFINLYHFIEEIKGVLSLSDDLDSCVECKFYNNEYNHEITKTWTIKHYGRQLDWSKNIDAYYESETVMKHDIVTLKPQLISLVQPQVRAQDLRHDMSWAGKSFKLPELDMCLAPYLLIPAKKSILFRPMLIPKFANNRNVQVEILTKAIREFGQNKQAIDQFLQENNFYDNDALWINVGSILNIHNHLPLNTFELLKSLARNFEALTFAVFRLNISLEILRRFETELSVLWYLVPITSWKKAIDQAIEYWTQFANDSSYGQSKVKRILEGLKQLTPLLGRSFQQFYLENSLDFGREYTLDFLQDCIFEGKYFGGKENTKYQELLHKHSIGKKWPTDLSRSRWVHFRNIDKLGFSIKLANQWHKDIVYLPFCLAYLNVMQKSSVDMNANEVLQIKQIIAFDELWFSDIFSVVVKYLILEKK